MSGVAGAGSVSRNVGCLVRSIVLVSLLMLAGCQHDPYAHLYNKAAQARPHEPLLIEPGSSVGKIKSGMTMEEVVAAVGEPDRRNGNKTLEYLRYGFAVSRGPGGVVGVVFCGGCSKGSPLSKMFAGRTREG